MLYVGIDPGNEGFIAVLDAEGRHKATHEMPVIEGEKKVLPDVPAIKRILSDLAGEDDITVFVESQTARPAIFTNSEGNLQRGQGSASIFSTGRWQGVLEGVLSGTYPVEFQTPGTWQKVMHEGATGNDTKAKSIQVAGRLFPLVDLRKNTRCRKPHDGKADALLMAEWLRRKHLGLLPGKQGRPRR